MNAVIVYLSDHGEEIYDYRDFKGRDYDQKKTKTVLYYQNGIPFMIWCSELFKKRYPEIVEDIKKSQNRPFMSDNTCQVLFHLAGMKSSLYNEENDVLSDHYIPKNRILYGLFDYDSMQ